MGFISKLSFGLLSVLSASFFLTSYSMAQSKGNPTESVFRWVSLSDLTQYGGTEYNTSAIENQIKRAFGEINLTALDVRFNQFPRSLDSHTEVIPFTASIGSEYIPDTQQNRRIQFFAKGNLIVKDKNEVIKMDSIQMIPFKNMKFQVRVGLDQLKVLVEDLENDIHIIYPLSAPGFDEGFTPRSQGSTIYLLPIIEGHLGRAVSVEKRNDPVYYKNKPFVRILPLGKTWSLFGFHTSPWTEQLERGWVSAGCMRLADNDLIEMYNIVRFAALDRVPLRIDYVLDISDEHPMPKMLNVYEKVIRSREKDGRMVFNTGRVKGAAPLDKLNRYRGFWPDHSGEGL